MSCPGCNTGGIFPHEAACELAGEREAKIYLRHQPVVAKHRDGWAVFCDACSTLVGDYVYPCQEGREFPPHILVPRQPTVDEESDRLGRVSLWLRHLDRLGRGVR